MDGTPVAAMFSQQTNFVFLSIEYQYDGLHPAIVPQLEGSHKRTGDFLEKMVSLVDRPVILAYYGRVK
jgi:hypothetical protein